MNKCKKCNIFILRKKLGLFLNLCENCQYIKISLKDYNNLFNSLIYENKFIFYKNKIPLKIRIEKFLKLGTIQLQNLQFNKENITQYKCTNCEQKLFSINNNELEFYFCKKCNLMYIQYNNYEKMIKKWLNKSKYTLWLRIINWFKV